METMQKAQRDTWQPLDKKATFERGADTPKERDAFNMMMGTDFVSSMGYMLKDHAPVRLYLSPCLPFCASYILCVDDFLGGHFIVCIGSATCIRTGLADGLSNGVCV